MSSNATGVSTPTEDAAGGLDKPCARGVVPSTLPAVNADYLHPQYWNERFKKEESFEWFKVGRSFCRSVQFSGNLRVRWDGGDTCLVCVYSGLDRFI